MTTETPATSSPQPGPPYLIIATAHEPNGMVSMVVRKRGGQLRKVYVPASRASGPELDRLAAGIVERWRPPPPDTLGR